MDFTALLAGADRAVLGVLGDGAITYSSGTGDSVDVAGIFDAAYVVASGPGEVGVSTVGPAVFVRLADLPSDPVTDVEATVTVNGTAYRPHEVKPDGKGGVLLLLHQI